MCRSRRTTTDKSATYIYVWYIDRATGTWRVAHQGFGLGGRFSVPQYTTVNVDVYMKDLPGISGWSLVRTTHKTAANWSGRGVEMKDTGDVCYA